MGKIITCAFIYLVMIVNFSCTTPPGAAHKDVKKPILPGYMEYKGDVLSQNGDTVGNLDFYYEENSQFFYLKLQTDVNADAKVMDPEFEGLKFINVQYKPIEAEFEGHSIARNESGLVFVSRINDQGLIAFIMLTANEEKGYSGKIDIRTEDDLKLILQISQQMNGGISPIVLYTLEKDARFIGDFLIDQL